MTARGRRPGWGCSRESVQVAPVRCGAGYSSDRSCGLFSVDKPSRLYSQQPPSNRTSVSPRIRLYASPTPQCADRLMRPVSLRPAGEAVLPGCRSLCADAEAVGGRLVVPRTPFAEQCSSGLHSVFTAHTQSEGGRTTSAPSGPLESVVVRRPTTSHAAES